MRDEDSLAPVRYFHSAAASVQYAVPATNRAVPMPFPSRSLRLPLSRSGSTTSSKPDFGYGSDRRLIKGGWIAFTTVPAAGATVLIRAGLSQYAQVTQCREHIAAAFQLANAKRAAAGKPTFPGFVSYHTESGMGIAMGATTATLPAVDATVPGQTDMTQEEHIRRCGRIVGGYFVGSTWTGGWARSFVDTRVTPNARYEPEQMMQMLMAYRWHQMVLGGLWYGEAHKCTYAWTGSTATDRMNLVYNKDIFKQGGSCAASTIPTSSPNPALTPRWAPPPKCGSRRDLLKSRTACPAFTIRTGSASSCGTTASAQRPSKTPRSSPCRSLTKKDVEKTIRYGPPLSSWPGRGQT
jgi:hypothetical protein